MRDHVQPRMRSSMALDPANVCIEQPDWGKELLATLVVAVAFLGVVLIAQFSSDAESLRIARADAARWKARAMQMDTTPTVRIEPQGVGFRCSHMNVRREWEAAVAAECQILGSLLHMARAAP